MQRPPTQDTDEFQDPLKQICMYKNLQPYPLRGTIKKLKEWNTQNEALHRNEQKIKFQKQDDRIETAKFNFINDFL